MSNDQVFPYDVTTKDDLFYHILCNYNEKSDKKNFFNNKIIGIITE